MTVLSFYKLLQKRNEKYNLLIDCAGFYHRLPDWVKEVVNKIEIVSIESMDETTLYVSTECTDNIK